MIRLDITQTWDGQPLPPAEQATVELSAHDATHLLWRFSAPYHGDPPPAHPPGPTPGLWNHEVVELFLAGPDERYLEVELGPHGHHLVLRLDGVRRPFAQGLDLHTRVTLHGERWTGEALLPRAWLPEGPHRANAYRIHGQGADRRYLAHAPAPGPQPDFHRLDRFVPIDLGSCTLPA